MKTVPAIGLTVMMQGLGQLTVDTEEVVQAGKQLAGDWMDATDEEKQELLNEAAKGKAALDALYGELQAWAKEEGLEL